MHPLSTIVTVQGITDAGTQHPNLLPHSYLANTDSLAIIMLNDMDDQQPDTWTIGHHSLSWSVITPENPLDKLLIQATVHCYSIVHIA